MEKIIKNRQIIDNVWRLEGDGELADDSSHDARIILSLATWLARSSTAEALDSPLSSAPRPPRLGVKLAACEGVDAIAADLHRIALVALEFGGFGEGRGYSQAVQLRQQHAFGGEIRALGAHRDNLPLMERCGIDAYHLAAGEDLQQALTAFDEITAYYPLNYAVV